jgi:hypothetical protein
VSNPAGTNENDLNRAMRHQVEHLHGAPLTLGDVQSRAKRIQRRRRIAASVAAAAAVAVITPIGVLLANNGPESSGPIHQPTATTPTTSTGVPATYTIDVTPPAEGTTLAELGIPYWSKGQLNSVTGEAVPIADRVYDAVRAPNGQWGAMTFDGQGAYSWTSFDPSGAVLAPPAAATSGQVAVTPDGSHYAYLAKSAPDGPGAASWQLTLGGTDGRTWDLGGAAPNAPGNGAVGILSDGSVVYEFEAGKPMLARPDGKTVAIPGVYLKTVAASYATGRIAVETSYNNDGTSCWATVDSSGTVDAEQCDHALGDFSADGKYVIGYPSDSDGLGPTSVSILDAATLQAVATFTMPRDGFLASNWAWTGHTIVANAFFGGTWNVELLGTDGVLQLRSVGTQGDETEPPFEFGAGPLNTSLP